MVAGSPILIEAVKLSGAGTAATLWVLAGVVMLMGGIFHFLSEVEE